MLTLLFKSASGAVMYWAENNGFMPGITMVLHTFGAQLNFNCHIHMLYTLGGINAETLKWKSNDFIHAQGIKQGFKMLLLKELRQASMAKQMIVPKTVKLAWRKSFGTDNFFLVQNALWKKNWFDYVGEKLENADLTVKYIGRYAKRPSLSEAKIEYYSQEEKIVRINYHDKITDTDQTLTLSVDDFIGRLVRHIPEKNFHMIRYGGLYANARIKKMFALIFGSLMARFGTARLLFGQLKTKTWRQRMIESTGNDPLKCPACHLTMSLTQIGYRTRDGTFKIVDIF